MNEQNSGYEHFQPNGGGFPPVGQAPKKKMGTGKKVGIGVVALLVVGGIGSAIGAGASGDDKDEPAPAAVEVDTDRPDTSRSDSSTRTAPRSSLRSAPAPKKRDPLTSDGKYKVGTDIEPGVYEYTPRQPDTPGYFERCADIACEIGTPGFIQNDLVFGPGYLEILPTDAYVELSRLDLTPAGGA